MTRWYEPIPESAGTRTPLILGRFDLKGLDEEILRLGQPIDRWDETIWYQAASPEEDGEPDDALLCYPADPVWSPRLQAALNHRGIADIQYLPVRILHFDGSPIEGFAIANLLSFVPALDKQRSEYDLFGDVPLGSLQPDRRDSILMLRKPVLRRSALAGYHIIRLREYPASFYVSEIFKDSFEAGGFTGYQFREMELS